MRKHSSKNEVWPPEPRNDQNRHANNRGEQLLVTGDPLKSFTMPAFHLKLVTNQSLDNGTETTEA